MTSTAVQHIIETPGLRGGKPHIAGTRITVSDIAYYHLKLGMPVAQVASELNLTMSDTYAALAYYFDHRAEIDQRTAEEDAYAEELERQNPSPFQERLRQLRGE